MKILLLTNRFSTIPLIGFYTLLFSAYRYKCDAYFKVFLKKKFSDFKVIKSVLCLSDFLKFLQFLFHIDTYRTIVRATIFSFHLDTIETLGLNHFLPKVNQASQWRHPKYQKCLPNSQTIYHQVWYHCHHQSLRPHHYQHKSNVLHNLWSVKTANRS